VYATIGTVAIVCVVPVLRRGTTVQRAGSVILIVLSALALWPAVDYWLRMNNRELASSDVATKVSAEILMALSWAPWVGPGGGDAP
jgi:hypothetical protein